jgi:hypothetical protein
MDGMTVQIPLLKILADVASNRAKQDFQTDANEAIGVTMLALANRGWDFRFPVPCLHVWEGVAVFDGDHADALESLA